MKQTLLLILLIFLPMAAMADVVEIDGIYYNLIEKDQQIGVAQVTSNPSKYSGDIVIPNTVEYHGNTYAVTTILPKAFSECKELTSIEISGNVTTIGSSSFYYSRKLNTVILHNGVISIESNAFRDCSELTSITIPGSLKSIGSYSFYGCSKLNKVIIKDIAAWCSIDLDYSKDSSPTQQGGGVHIYSDEKSEIIELVIPEGVEKINSLTFDNCKYITSLQIPNSVKTIDKYAFSRCSGLRDIKIPNSVETIGIYAFSGCESLTTIQIPNSILYINGGMFENCTNLVSINIPNNIKIISEDAFSGCTNLSDITIGNGVTSILKRAFLKCEKLANVYCTAEKVPKTESNSFSGSFIDYATLHVPAVAYDSYKSQAPWNQFKSIFTLESEIPDAKKCEAPTISYENGELKYHCSTNGAEFISEITDSDIQKYYKGTIKLTTTYNISVYAIKSGYDNSDVVTATLCWLECEPKTENFINSVAEVKARPVLIQARGGLLTISGADDGQNITVYDLSGQLRGFGTAANGSVIIDTRMSSGEIVIVKIGKDTLKAIL